jgi:uncharacterized protein YegL
MLFENESSTLARLPVYLLLDTSATMAGAPIEAVNQGVQLLFTQLVNTPQTQNTVSICAITFASFASVIHPFSEVLSFHPPVLRTRGASMMARALELTMDCLERDLHPPGDNHPGDYRPQIVIMTDGKLTDAWESAMRKLQRHKFRPSRILILFCGSDTPDDEHWRGYTIAHMNHFSGEQFLSLLRWIVLD